MRRLRLGVDDTVDVLAELRFVAERGGWRSQAVCGQIDPELWFPDRGMSVTAPARWCMTCPVMAECRADAFTNDERWGVWGGLSEPQRTKATRSRRAEREALIEALTHVDGLTQVAPLRTEDDNEETGATAA